MPKKSATYPTEDMVLWQRVTSQVTPLKSAKQSVSFTSLGAKLTERQNKVLKKNVRTQKKMVPDDIPVRPAGTASKKDRLEQVSPVDLRHGEKAGIDGSTLRRLFRGEIPIDLRLDLHGMTAARGTQTAYPIDSTGS